MHKVEGLRSRRHKRSLRMPRAPGQVAVQEATDGHSKEFWAYNQKVTDATGSERRYSKGQRDIGTAMVMVFSSPQTREKSSPILYACVLTLPCVW